MSKGAKIAWWSLGSVVLLLALVSILVLIMGNTAAGRRGIEELISRLTAGSVTLNGLTGGFPSHLRLEQLQLRDDLGVWLTADGVTLDWNPAALLDWVVSVRTLRAMQLSMERLPHSNSSSGGEASIPRIDVGQAQIMRVEFGADLTGTRVSLTLDGSAHLRSVRDMQFDLAARRIDDDGQYDLALQFDARRMHADLRVRERADGPLQHMLSLPGLGALDARLNLDGPRSGENVELSINSDGASAHARGLLNLSANTADFDFDVEARALRPRPDVQWSHAAAHGHWSGGLKEPTATGHVEAANLELPGNVQMKHVGADVSAENGAVSLRAVIEALRIPGTEPSLLATDPIEVTANMKLDEASRPLDFHASHRLFALQGRWLSSGAQTASLDLRLNDLAPFSGLIGQQIGGTANLRGQFDFTRASTRASMTASADFKPGTPGWPEMLGEHASAEMSGSISGDSISIDSVKVLGRALHASAAGSMTLPRRELSARWTLNVDDLSTLSPALAGKVTAAGSLQGPFRALAMDVQANAELSVHDGPRGALAAKLMMQGIPEAPAGSLTADGLLDGAPLRAELSLQRTSSGTLHTVVKQASWQSAHIDADVTTKIADQTSRGEIRLTVGELRDLKHLLGVDIAGNLAGDLMLRPEGAKTHVDVQVQTSNLMVAGSAAALQISGSGAGDVFAFSADAKLPQLGGAGPVVLNTAGTLGIGTRRLSLSQASIDYRGLAVRLLNAASLDFRDGLAVDELRLGSQGAQFDLDGRVFPVPSLRFSLSNVQPTLINLFVPGLLTAGRIDARGEIHDSLTMPTGQVSLNASGLRFADDAALGVPESKLTVKSDLRGTDAQVDASLNAGSGSQLTISGSAPLTHDGALDLKVAGKMGIALINPVLEAHGQHAEGTLDVDAHVGGMLASPQIGGRATLSGGSFRDYGRGVSLTTIEAELVGDQAAMQIKSLTAAAAPGTLSVTGSIGVLQPKMPIDLHISAQNAQPVASKLVTATLNADLHLAGTLSEHLTLAGNLHLNRTLIGIPNSFPPNVAVLDVRRRGAGARPVPDKPLLIDLDLKVQAPNQILVQGRGLDAEMGGELRIGGNTASPRIDGGFDLQRGSFSLASSKLNFSAGHIGFSGEGVQGKIDPTLDFTADTAIPQGTATLHVGGYADSPQFDFSSTPALPQDEIMARLMFGESASQLSALQLAQIGAALASLSGVGGGGGGLNPLAKIQKTLGLDRLSLGAGTPTSATGTENTGASIEAGRYISKRVYIEAKQNTSGTSQLEADVDLTKRLKLQTRLGNGTASVQGTTPENDPGSSIGLIYQFEY